MTPAAPPSSELPCHACDYDLRAQPTDGVCPECGASVAEAKRLSATQKRPAWANSDPRWRRRMIAGAWLLVAMPLVDVITTAFPASIPMSSPLFPADAILTLDDTLLQQSEIFWLTCFCVGIALLCSKERGRRDNRWDWTRRWGVLSAYIVYGLGLVPLLFVGALVAVGIAALFQSMLPRYQPVITQPLVEIAGAYLRYAPQPSSGSVIVMAAFASLAVLFACAALYNALRSCGPRWMAALFVGLLGLFAVWNLLELARGTLQYLAALAGPRDLEVMLRSTYFEPRVFTGYLFSGPDRLLFRTLPPGTWFGEAAKWALFFAIAIRLSVAQIIAWRRRKQTTRDATQRTSNS